MVIFSEITEKGHVKQRYPHSKAKFRLVQHFAAISASAEITFKNKLAYAVKDKPLAAINFTLKVKHPGKMSPKIISLLPSDSL